MNVLGALAHQGTADASSDG